MQSPLQIATKCKKNYSTERQFFFFVFRKNYPENVTQQFNLFFSGILWYFTVGKSPSQMLCKIYINVQNLFFQLHIFDRCFPHSSAGKESTCNAGDPSSIPGLGRSTWERIGYPLQYSWASLVAQLVKNLPPMQETWVWSLGWEDTLEKGKATHSSILAWRIPWTVHGVAKSRTWLSNFHFHYNWQ